METTQPQVGENAQPQAQEQEQTITVKYNHEEKQIPASEAAALAQKGMNYDKVYEQRQTLATKLEDAHKQLENLRGTSRQEGQRQQRSESADGVQRSSEQDSKQDSEQEAADRQPTTQPEQTAQDKLIENQINELTKAFPNADLAAIPDAVLMAAKDNDVPLALAYAAHRENLLRGQMRQLVDKLDIKRVNDQNAASSMGSVITGDAVPSELSVQSINAMTSEQRRKNMDARDRFMAEMNGVIWHDPDEYGVTTADRNSRWAYMTKEERDTLRYHYGKGDDDSFDAYLEVLERELKRRKKAGEITKDEEWVDEAGPWGEINAAFKAINAKLMSVFSLAETGWAAISGQEVDPTSFIQLTVSSAGTYQELATKHTEGFAKVVIDAGISLAGNLPSIGLAVAGMPLAGAVFAGTQAAGSAATEAIERGFTPAEAFAQGLAQGAIEMLMERIPLNVLGDIAQASKIVIKCGKIGAVAVHMGVEGTQEWATAVVSSVADTIMAGEKSALYQQVQANMADGMTEKEAWAAAQYKTFFEDPLYEGLVGMVSGGISGGAAAARSHAVTKMRFNNNMMLFRDAAQLSNIETGIKTEIMNQLNEITQRNKTKALAAPKDAPLLEGAAQSKPQTPAQQDAGSGDIAGLPYKKANLLTAQDSATANAMGEGSLRTPDGQKGKQRVQQPHEVNQRTGESQPSADGKQTADASQTQAEAALTETQTQTQTETQAQANIKEGKQTNDQSVFTQQQGKSTQELFAEFTNTLGTDNMPSLKEFTAMREQGGRAWNELTMQAQHQQALDSGSIPPSAKLGEYQNVIIYVENVAPDVVALYGNDVNAAVGAVLQQMKDANVSVESAVAKVRETKTSGGGSARESVVESVDSSKDNQTNDYRRTFFKAYPELEGSVIVHHAIEQQVLKRYEGIFTEQEIHALDNLRGIPKDLNNSLHLSKLRKGWNKFYRDHPKPTRQDLIEFMKYLDKEYGMLFSPKVK